METLTISHSTKDSEVYRLTCEGIWIGNAKKTTEGFFAHIYSTGETLEAESMKALKAAVLKSVEILQGLKAQIKAAAAKPYYITVDDARKLCVISHGGIRIRLKELNENHPYLKQHQLGAAICRQHFETLASVPGEQGRWEREWLVKNKPLLPLMKKVDLEETYRQRRPVYLSEELT